MTLPIITRHDEAALLELIFDLGKIGAVESGGICRLAASPSDGKGRRFLGDQFAEIGALESVDAIGNQFGRMLFGSDRGAILCGSHLDTQPTGGRYDGAFGIAAAIIAARILARNAEAAAYRHDLVICNWTNEEGARFTPSLTGSSVFAGNLELEAAKQLRDATGVTLGDALTAIGYSGKDTGPKDAIAAVELHIEQGSILEQAGATIGIVERNWAARKLQLCFRGEPCHTGPTAKSLRKDALLAAARFVSQAHDLANVHPKDPILAIARIENGPNSANVVSCETRIWVEIRHPDIEVCKAFGTDLLDKGNSKPVLGGCKIEIEHDDLRHQTCLCEDGQRLAAKVCQRQGLRFERMTTVSGHDAVALARALPSTLLFVPSKGGISHSPKEFTSPKHLITGLHVLVEWLHLRLT